MRSRQRSASSTGAESSLRAVVAPVPMRSLGEACGRWPDARLLDVREAAAFATGHATGAGRIAREEFRARRMELPSRNEAMLVMHESAEDARVAALELAGLGYTQVAWLDASLASDPQGLASREPAARLWSPSPFLERVCPSLPRGRALDLACGSGRTSVFLAHGGWDVEGWDVDPSALDLARAFAARERVRATFREVDLEDGALPACDAAFDVIVVIRYLHRELFPWLEHALAPGGALVYETFRHGQERFGTPRNPRHLLEPGELLCAFPSLAIEFHEETPDDRAPVLSRVVARKR